MSDQTENHPATFWKKVLGAVRRAPWPALRANAVVVWKVIFYRSWIATIVLIVLSLILDLEPAKDLVWNVHETLPPISGTGRWSSSYVALWLSALVLALVLAAISSLTGNLRLEQKPKSLQTMMRPISFLGIPGAFWLQRWQLFTGRSVTKHITIGLQSSSRGARHSYCGPRFLAYGPPNALPRYLRAILAFILAVVAVVFIVALIWLEPGLSLSLLAPPVTGLIALWVRSKCSMPSVS